jgi:hypothetical protein
MSGDTGRRCPRCDCPDGHSQCEHCKTCPHARPQSAPDEPTRLTYEQALPIAAALHARTQSPTPPPFPGCPTCGTTPAVLDLSDDTTFTEDVIVIRYRPCGHVFTVTREDLRAAYHHAREAAT